jgi:hypothetical protein
MLRSLKAVLVLSAACWTLSCQSPTDPAVDVTEFVETTVAPTPAAASGPTGRFYTYVPTNNQPNEQREFDWRTSFAVGVTLNSHANDDKFGVEFPVKISAATVKVQQASGGIITPPTGSDTEHYEFDFQVATNTFPAANNTVNMSFDVWYDLPNLRREALVTVTLAFTDSSSRSFSRTVEVRVAP